MIPGSANPLLLASAAAGYEIERSLRFNSSDSAYLGATFGTPTDQDVFTLSMWVKRSALGSTQQLFGVSTNHSFGFTSGDALNLTFGGSSALTTTALFRDPSAWYHIMWVQNGTSHTLYVNGTSVGTATATSNTFNTAVAHQIGAGNTTNFFNGYLAYVHFIDGQAKAPSAFGANDDNGIWQPIVYAGTYGANGFELKMDDNSTAAALGTDTSGNGNDWTPNNFSVQDGTGSYIKDVTGTPFNASFGPENAFDGNLATESLATSSSSMTWTPSPSISASTQIRLYLYRRGAGDVLTLNGSSIASAAAAVISSDSAGWYTISGTSITSLVWGRAAGANDWRLRAVEVDGTILVDYEVAINNDSLVDVPTNGTETDTGVGGEVRGNYCTLNPLFKTGPGTPAYSNGNLDLSAGGSGDSYFAGTFLFSAGKYYYEATINAVGSGVLIGVCRESDSTSTGNIGTYRNTGVIYNLDSTTQTSGSTYTTGDVIGVAIDCDNGEVQFYKNGVGQGATPSFTFTAGTKLIVRGRSDDPGASLSFNFGQRPFAYTAPSGFKALCTANLPSTTITTSGSYTGNGVADGPFVFLNGVPTAMTVDGNSVTFGTDADKLSNGFKIRTTSTTYNQNASTYNYTITSTGAPFKTARAQPNP